jgi:hypothetical protein
MNTIQSAEPLPGPGFETEVLQEIRDLFQALPKGKAALKIGRVPGHSDWPEPYFEVIPANRNAAAFKGFAVQTDLNLIVGEAAHREYYGFAKGGTVVAGVDWHVEFQLIWAAVVAGGFAEQIYRDSNGKAIGSATRLTVGGKQMIIRNGRRAETLFGRQIAEVRHYEPY